MEDKTQIPYIVHESIQARNERMTKRLIVALIVAVVLIFASNAMWLYYFNQLEFTSDALEILVDGKDGVANFIGNNGSISNGTNSGEDNTQDDEEKER